MHWALVNLEQVLTLLLSQFSHLYCGNNDSTVPTSSGALARVKWMKTHEEPRIGPALSSAQYEWSCCCYIHVIVITSPKLPQFPALRDATSSLCHPHRSVSPLQTSAPQLQHKGGGRAEPRSSALSSGSFWSAVTSLQVAVTCACAHESFVTLNGIYTLRSLSIVEWLD